MFWTGFEGTSKPGVVTASTMSSDVFIGSGFSANQYQAPAAIAIRRTAPRTSFALMSKVSILLNYLNFTTGVKIVNMALVDDLIAKGVLKSQKLIRAFRAVDRKDFLPQELKDYAYIDEPLSIGEGQTISQPWTVAFMLELLEPKPGENIMEIGYGSGWQTALLAAVGANVYAIERVPALCEFGRGNFEKFSKAVKPPLGGFTAKFFCQDGTLGLPKIAEKIGGFDKIVAAAAAWDEIPKDWKEQLKVGGKIVAPIGQSIFEFTKKPDGSLGEVEHPGFAFVPLVIDKPTT